MCIGLDKCLKRRIREREKHPFSIFNIAGQQVWATKAQGAQRLDVSNLPSGLYIIRTSMGDVARFIKQ